MKQALAGGLLLGLVGCIGNGLLAPGLTLNPPTITLELNAGSPTAMSHSSTAVLRGTFTGAVGGTLSMTSAHVHFDATYGTGCTAAIDSSNTHSPIQAGDYVLISITGCTDSSAQAGHTVNITVDNSALRSSARVIGVGLTSVYSGIVVDNVAPSIATAPTPLHANVPSGVNTFTVAFNEPVTAVESSLFVPQSNGGCTTYPQVIVSPTSSDGGITWSVPVDAGVGCVAGTTIVMDVNFDGAVADVAGNKDTADTGVTATYNIVPVRRIFVTGAGTNGALGGASGADSFCQTDLSGVVTSTSFKALIVDGVARVACQTGDGLSHCTSGVTGQLDWVLSSDFPYFQSDGTTQIGWTNVSKHFVFPLTTPLSSSAYDVWTGMNADWTSAGGHNCSAFTSNSVAQDGNFGDSSILTSGQMIFSGTPSACNSVTKKLYCVEQ